MPLKKRSPQKEQFFKKKNDVTSALAVILYQFSLFKMFCKKTKKQPFISFIKALPELCNLIPIT